MALENDFGAMLPGSGTEIQTVQRRILYKKWANLIIDTDIIAAAAVDSLATMGRTTWLPAGLRLGRITASKKLTVYDPSAIDGSATMVGILWSPVDMIDKATMAAVDRIGYVILAGGLVYDAQLIGAGHSGADSSARSDVATRIQFAETLGYV